MGSGPRGTMSYRMQGIFCPSVRSSVSWGLAFGAWPQPLGRIYVRMYEQTKYPLHSIGHRPSGAAARKGVSIFLSRSGNIAAAPAQHLCLGGRIPLLLFPHLQPFLQAGSVTISAGSAARARLQQVFGFFGDETNPTARAAVRRTH